MTWGLVKTVGPWIAIAMLLALVLGQHDQLVTWRLKDKDQQAITTNLRRDIQDRDKIIRANASSEAGDRGDADKSCAADISSSFQKGVTYGRAISNASKPAPASGQQPAPGVVRDYRTLRAGEAYRPAP